MKAVSIYKRMLLHVLHVDIPFSVEETTNKQVLAKGEDRSFVTAETMFLTIDEVTGISHVRLGGL